MAKEDLRRLKTEVLAATDVAALIGEYVTLKRSGRSLVALCPFHEEKTPSFHVNLERQTWHCFGRCSRGGNAIDFLMEKEGLDFWPALKHLAERAGVALPERVGGSDAPDERAVCMRVSDVAQSFFRQALVKSREAEEARAYLEGRGVDEASAERFGLGYAPVSGVHLRRFLQRRGVSDQDAEVAGLIGARENGGYFDRFRGRLMFPIRDGLGRVTGFGARALRPEDQPKYKNTPETAAFKKRELIYGLYEAKEGLRERGEAAIVEGYLDVILAHQAGFPWLVATLGTAFGADHASQLRRLVSRVSVVFDGDEAGMRANLRGLEELAQAVFRGARPFEELRVATLPDGLDPADLVVQRGPRALADALKEARTLVDFLVPLDARRLGVEKKVEALTRAARVLAAFDNDAYREVQLAEVAHRLGVDEQAVRQEAAKARRAPAPGPRPSDEDAAREARAAESAAEAPLPRLELHALRCLLGEPALAARGPQELPLEAFEDARAREIAAALYTGEPIAGLRSEPARRLAARLAAERAPHEAPEHYESTWVGVVEVLARRRIEREAPTDDDEASLRAFYEAHRRLKTAQASE